MKQKINTILVALALVFVSGMTLAPATASAAFKDDACEGVNTLSNTAGNACDANAGSKVEGLITAVINIFSIIVGFAALVMIIVGGFKYITANGDSGSLASARNTILYALIGAILVAVAQTLVHFVIRKATAP